jgi:hypothetical protein
MAATRKYRLLGGFHTTKTWVDADSTKGAVKGLAEIRDPFTGKTKMMQLVSTQYKAGDEINSDIDLITKFGSNRFEQVIKTGSVAEVVHDDGTSRKLMEKMRVEDLRKYAEEEEIDLEEAVVKKDIIKKILDARTLAST